MAFTTLSPVYITTVEVSNASRQFTVAPSTINGNAKYLILFGVVAYADGSRVSFDARDHWQRWARSTTYFGRAAAVVAFLNFGWAAKVEDFYALDAGTAYDHSEIVTVKENVAVSNIYLSVLVLA